VLYKRAQPVTIICPFNVIHEQITMTTDTQTQTINVGLIGAGSRGKGVARNIIDHSRGRVRLTRFFDTNPKRIDTVRAISGAEDVQSADRFEDVVDDPDIDAVIVGTPNGFHRAPAEYTMRAGKLLYLEKPLAATLEDSLSILKTQQETNACVLVGFVMRFTQFYRKVRELVQSGLIGQVQTLHADEQMGIALTADIYLRGWRADTKVSGPLLLEKCCHDLDMINWVLGAKCQQVSAVSDRTVFLPRPDAPMRCRDCDDQQCAYRSAQTIAGKDEKIYNADLNDGCVYNMDKDIADHTSVVARYDGGVHVLFNVTAGAPHTRRSIDIIGSKGRLTGVFEEHRLWFYPLGGEDKPQPIDLGERLPGGHGGGDGVIAQSFIDLYDDPQMSFESTIEAGFESALVCFAAEKAANGNCVVDVNALRGG